MPNVAWVSICLLYLNHGRRMQFSVAQSRGSPCAESKELLNAKSTSTLLSNEGVSVKSILRELKTLAKPLLRSKPLVAAWIASSQVGNGFSANGINSPNHIVHPVTRTFVSSATKHSLPNNISLSASHPMALIREGSSLYPAKAIVASGEEEHATSHPVTAQRHNHRNGHFSLITMSGIPDGLNTTMSDDYSNMDHSTKDKSSQSSDDQALLKETSAALVREKETKWGNAADLLGSVCLVISTFFSRIFLRSQHRVSSREGNAGEAAAKKGLTMDIPLLICIALWYIGNYYFSITNKIALNAAGGSAGFPITIGTCQLGIGVLYAVFLWTAPDARPKPSITIRDYMATLPVGVTAAGAYAATVFALSAGTVSFVQVVKAAEPAFTAVLGWVFYNDFVSTAKLFCLVPVIGGVILASLGELNFVWTALATAALANVLAAVQVNENRKLMSTAGIADRLGSVSNQFAITVINAFVFCIPLMIATEGHKFGAFLQLCRTSSVVLNNLVFSGLWLYLSNELATLVIKKTGALAQSVANTAKRVIVIIVVALVMGEDLGVLKLLGCFIGIGGVFLYSIIDQLVAKKASSDSAMPVL